MKNEILEEPVKELLDKEEVKQREILFSEMWSWMEGRIRRINRLKGWITNNRSNGEMIALIHAELSECLEYMRAGNPKSDHINTSGCEEELADVIIRVMDLAKARKWDIPKALFKKIAYNKKRPYRHGGKKF